MITSRSNAWFKRVRDALRQHAGEIVIEGPKAVADAVAAGWKPIAIPQFSPALLKSISDTKMWQRAPSSVEGSTQPGNTHRHRDFGKGGITQCRSGSRNPAVAQLRAAAVTPHSPLARERVARSAG